MVIVMGCHRFSVLARGACSGSKISMSAKHRATRHGSAAAGTRRCAALHLIGFGGGFGLVLWCRQSEQLARQAPSHPILVIADYYLASVLSQPTWVEDLRPFRAVMMGLDLPAKPDDIDRFIPPRQHWSRVAGAGPTELRP